ncbi:uncharacterized protein LOC111346488 [Stylophora pistillata]|uniref:uncharacterized protein LOC111346488 n=1 Tax=Stylophora pistillata TaxID=50429 RepID=UPI000C0566B3|nr:uncharacterized protein LOC111346488 [Stylophora pistillata]
MASGFSLPPPAPLELHDQNAAEKWKKFHLAWTSYSLATELNKKAQPVQVATLLTVIGEEARDVYSTFTDWTEEGDENKIAPVLTKFAEYCQPRKNVPFERYRFNRRSQEAGETYDQYKTALRKLAAGCEFNTITPDEILRDRLIFGIRDTKVRERLLREAALTLAKTDEICRAAESMQAQMKVVGDATESETNKVDQERTSNVRKPKKNMRRRQQQSQRGRNWRECDNCGYQHMENLESCPALGKECLKCGKRNLFIAKCKYKEVKAADLEDEELFQDYHVFKRPELENRSVKTQLSLEIDRKLEFEPQVEWFMHQKEKKYELFSKSLSDPRFDEQWYIKRPAGSTEPTYNILSAWKAGYTGKGIWVAVVDDGVDGSLPELSPNYVNTLFHKIIVFNY